MTARLKAEHKHNLKVIKSSYKPLKLKSTVDKTKLIPFALLPLSSIERIGFNVSLNNIGIKSEKIDIKKARYGSHSKWTYSCHARSINQIEIAIRYYEKLWIEKGNFIFKNSISRNVKLWKIMETYLKE